jgi:hypothetical protein
MDEITPDKNAKNNAVNVLDIDQVKPH